MLSEGRSDEGVRQAITRVINLFSSDRRPPEAKTFDKLSPEDPPTPTSRCFPSRWDKKDKDKGKDKDKDRYRDKDKDKN